MNKSGIVNFATVRDYNKIPFAAPGDKEEIKAVLHHRLKVVKRFIGWNLEFSKTLDVGQSNRFGRALGIKHNTLDTDYNEVLLAPDKDYDVITCFEILEHQMNPLNFLRSIHGLLKPGGYLYLSTPVAHWSSIYQTKNHVIEYKPDRLRRMLEWAGFEVVKMKKMCPWDWWFMFWGVRPILRVLTMRSQLWELRKPEKMPQDYYC